MFAKLPNAVWLFPLALVVFSTTLAAQVAAPSSADASFGPPPYYGFGGMGMGWGGGIGDWAAGSTVAGSYMAGMGQAIRAQGQYNLMTSEAAVNLEEAEKRDIQNRALWTNTYFEMRKINNANRFGNRGPTRSQDDWARIAQQRAPRRLDTDQLDPITGAIHWPAALGGDEFRKDREKLDELFAERAKSHGAVGMSNYKEIRATVDNALATLKGQIRGLDARFYTQAKNFLTSLGREADFPTG